MLARVHRAVPTLPPNQVGEQDIIDMFNEGLYHLATVTSKVSHLRCALDAGSNTIPFPEDFLRISNVYDGNTNKELWQMEGHYKTKEDSTGEPKEYYIEDGRLHFYPTPLVDTSVVIEYMRRPTELVNDDDEPDIENTEEYLIAYAVRNIYFESGSPMFQYWDSKRTEALAHFVHTTEDTYSAPFRIVQSW